VELADVQLSRSMREYGFANRRQTEAEGDAKSGPKPTSVHVCVTPKDFVGRYCRKYFRSETKIQASSLWARDKASMAVPLSFPRQLVIFGVGGPYRLGSRDPKRPTILRILECTLVELTDGGASSAKRRRFAALDCTRSRQSSMVCCRDTAGKVRCTGDRIRRCL
jgi:hypothetical protein